MGVSTWKGVPQEWGVTIQLLTYLKYFFLNKIKTKKKKIVGTIQIVFSNKQLD